MADLLATISAPRCSFGERYIAYGFFHVGIAVLPAACHDAAHPASILPLADHMPAPDGLRLLTLIYLPYLQRNISLEM